MKIMKKEQLSTFLINNPDFNIYERNLFKLGFEKIDRTTEQNIESIENLYVIKSCLETIYICEVKNQNMEVYKLEK